MAGQINIAGTSGSVQLFGNDTIVTDINIYFPPAGGLLFANGNALEATDGTFSGTVKSTDVTAGDYVIGSAGTTTGCHVAGTGGFVAVRPADKASSPILQGGVVGDINSISNILINADGSIDAAGAVTSDTEVTSGDRSSNSNDYTRISPGSALINLGSAGTTPALRIAVNASDVATIKADGSINAEGAIKSTGSQASSTSFQTGYSITPNCFVVRANGTIVGTENGNATTGNYKYKIDSNGAATFTGKGTFGDDVRVQSGRFHATAIANSNVWTGFEAGNGTATSTIKSDGTATFKNTFFSLDPDNPANYVSTTNSDGETEQVYNGPTLDMKKVGLALVALKAAAAASTDHASLKAAIATALADL